MDFSFDFWTSIPLQLNAILVIAISVTLISYWYVGVPKNLPNGSAGIPILGYLPFLGKDISLTLHQLAKEKFGNIFHLYVGSTLVVFLDDYPSIKEALIKQGTTFIERPLDAGFMESEENNFGLMTTNGEYWKQHRKFINSNLKDYGMGKMRLEPVILTEINHFLNEIRKLNGKPADIDDSLQLSLINNIYVLVFGHHFGYTHPIIQSMLHNLKMFNEITGTVSMETFFPWLLYIPGSNILTKHKLRRHMFKTFLDIVKVMTGPIIANFNMGGEVDNYVHAYLTERHARLKVNNNEQIFNEEGLVQNIRDIIVAASDTTANTIIWALLYMTKYPLIQKKIQKEIDDVIGRHREPSFNDRSKTPYTEATICEVHRSASFIPLVPRRTAEETTLCGYTIPKHTTVVCNVRAVHNDPQLWGDPDNFRPERFLDPNGDVIRPEYLMPFSIGKRACLGEPLAKMEVYLYFTSLLQNFDFVPVNGREPSLEVITNFFRLPKYPTVCAKLRSPN